jgi:hypothetical protein
MVSSGGRGEYMKSAFSASTSIHILTSSTGLVDLNSSLRTLMRNRPVWQRCSMWGIHHLRPVPFFKKVLAKTRVLTST